MADWTKMYNDLSEVYIKEFESRWAEGAIAAKSITAFLKRNYPHIQRLVDIPCGIGRLSIPLAMNGYKILGLDFSEKFISYANQKAKVANLDNIKFQVNDMLSSSHPIKNSLPDAIINWWTSFGYHGEAYDESFFRMLSSSTNKGALLITETWHRNYILNNPITRRWDLLDDLFTTIENHIDPLKKLVISEHIYYKKINDTLKELGRFKSEIMLYDSADIISLLERSGWNTISVYNSILSLEPFDPSKDRIVIISENCVS
ncbi:MAG: class I SAM-dependent methyltransferase [Thermoplasmatales archaeon]